MNIEKPSWDKLAKEASRDTDEGWDQVNNWLEMKAVVDDPRIILEAYEGLESDNEHIQDLAASVFQYQETEVFKNCLSENPELTSRLRKTMDEGRGPYAQFRAAFALYKHGFRDDEITDIQKEVDDE